MYHFVHDNMQEAAYSLLSENSKEILLCIGKKSQKLLSKEELYEIIFIVIKLISYSLELLEDQEDKLQIVDLHILAGDRALKTTALAKAFEYFESGIKLLDEDCWDKCYDLILIIHDRASKSAYCTSDYIQMTATLDETLMHASSSLD